MNRQAPHADAINDPYAGAHMQHMPAQKMQSNAGMKAFPGHTFTAAQGNSYASSQVEGQWNWHRNAPNPIPAFPYVEGQVNAARPVLEGHIADPKVDFVKKSIKDTRSQSLEQDMEIGYEDKPSLLTFEGLEQRFHEEIMQLVKEQNDIEDAENARHKEKLIEINNQYQEKLRALRTQQVSRREEFLRKESQDRLLQYQNAGISHHPTRAGNNDPPHFSGAGAPLEVERAHMAGQFDSYRERHSFLAGGRSQGSEVRVVPYPEGLAGGRDQGNEARVPYPESHTGVWNQGSEARIPHQEGLVGGRNQGSETRAQYLEGRAGGRSQGNEARVPYPEGRVYNKSAARFN